MIDTKLNIKDFIVVDIENPNAKADSICSIAFILVKDGKILSQKYSLINPEDRFDDFNIRINRITPNMVKDSITFDEFWDTNKEIFENNIIVGHNVKYDLSVISKALSRYNVDLPTLKMICTQKLSQKYLEVNKYKLDYLCDYLHINLDDHHNALCDTKACYEIFEYINNNYGLDKSDIEEYNYIESKSRSNGIRIIYSDDTKGLQYLKSIIESIISDGKIELDEINELNEWLESNTQLIGNYPFDKIYMIVKNALEDGEISQNEYDDLMKIFKEFINPIEEQQSDKNIDFKEKVFCLTGTFNSGSKDSIEEKIINKGGICGKGVTSKTNYLVVGGAGSDAWKFGNYGGKVQKAMELKEKGINIEIIGEDDFFKQL